MPDLPQNSTSSSDAHADVETRNTADTTVTEEVRIAVVMYGGVSLAIYMNGIAQELLHLVRATARDDASSEFRFDSQPVRPGDGYSPTSMASTEPVYRKLAQILSAPGPERAQLVSSTREDGSANNIRFIVDVVTGTSAGGINGIFLSKALATGGPMDMLERLWIEEGDIGKLINDSKSRGNGVSLPNTGKPQSLLNSDRMYVKLLDAFSSMSEDPRLASSIAKPLVEELDLFVTTTDIRGRVVPLRTFDRLVYERRFRHVFRFQYSHPNFGLTDIDRAQILSEKVEGLYDFRSDNDPFLAFAARCTSSFPFAFEPMRLEKVTELARTKIDPTILDYWKKRFFTVTHLAEEPPDEPNESMSAKLFRWLRRTPQSPGLPIEKRPFGDGGYLDNKPFGYAIEMLTHRQSLLPGTRKLIYIEPSPEHPEEELDSVEPPDAVENSLAALTKLPGYETIREDLMRVNERNRLVRKVKELTSKVVDTVIQNEQPIAPTLQEVIKRIAQGAELSMRGDLKRIAGAETTSTALSGFSSYLGYNLLRVYDVTDQLAAIAGTMAKIERESSYFYAIRCIVRAWREHTYERGGDKSLATFLSECDLWFYLRWVKFLRVQIDQIYPLDDNAQGRIRNLVRDATQYEGYSFSPAGKPIFQATLRRIADAIADLFCQFRAVGERLAYDAPSATLLTLLDSRRGFKTPEEVRAVLVEYYRLLTGQSPPLALEGAEPVIAGVNWKTLWEELVRLDGGVLDYILGVSSPERLATGSDTGRADSRGRATEKSKEKRGSRFAPRSEESDREYVKRAVRLLAEFPAISQVVNIVASRMSQQISAALPLSKLVVDPGDASGETKISLAQYVTNLIGPEQSATLTNLDERLAYDVVWRLLGLFPDIDAATFPMTYETELGEPELVDVIRFSPEDSTTIVDEALSRTRKLHGTSLGHFGAFLDARWRRYDILWGRLDAAERLIRALWRIRPPQDQAQKDARQKLIDAAHELIIGDYLVSYTDERVIAELQGTTVSDALVNRTSASASGA